MILITDINLTVATLLGIADENNESVTEFVVALTIKEFFLRKC